MSDYSGKYTNMVRDCAIMSLLAKEHYAIIGPPGYGKTDMLKEAMEHVMPSSSLFMEFDPSTPPEAVKGVYDPAAVLQGKLVRLLENTPNDPKINLVLCDELFRGPDIVFDTMIHLLSNKNRTFAEKTIYWGTSNFVPKSERQAALLDRIAIWLHLKEEDFNVADIIECDVENDRHTWENSFPTWEECQSIQRAVPNEDTRKVIADHLTMIKKEARSIGLVVNPRRIKQWKWILYRVAVYTLKTEQFTTVPNAAIRALMFCYPTIKADEANQFAQIVYATCNPENAAILEYRTIMLNTIKKIIDDKDGSTEDKCTKVSEVIDRARADIGKILPESDAEEFMNKHVAWAIGILSGNKPKTDAPPQMPRKMTAEEGLFAGAME